MPDFNWKSEKLEKIEIEKMAPACKRVFLGKISPRKSLSPITAKSCIGVDFILLTISFSSCECMFYLDYVDEMFILKGKAMKVANIADGRNLSESDSDVIRHTYTRHESVYHATDGKSIRPTSRL